MAVDAVAVVAAGGLVAASVGTIDPGRSTLTVVAVTVVAAVLAGMVAAVADGGVRSPLLGPVVLAWAVPGLVHAGDSSWPVVGTAVALMFPLAVVCACWRPLGAVHGAVAVVGLAGALARLVFRDPFRELRCAPACRPNPWLIERHHDLVSTAETAVAVSGAALAVVLIVSSAGPRARRAALGLALLVWSVGLLVEPRPQAGDGRDVAVWAAVGGLAAVAALPEPVRSVRLAMLRRRVRTAAAELLRHRDRASIEGELRRAARDPTLTVGFGGVGSRSPGRAHTTVRRGDRIIAVIDHVPSAGPAVNLALSPMVVMAIENEHLLATATAEVDELRVARREVVARVDGERRRLERDLHDGVQQRLLVLGMDLARAADAAATPAERQRLVDATSEATGALAELRRLVRTHAQAAVDDLGLEEALRSALAEAPVPATLTVRDLPPGVPSDVARAAYRLVVTSLAEAVRHGATRVDVTLAGAPGQPFQVEIGHDAPSAPVDQIGDRDRVAAAGGRIEIGEGPGPRLRAVFP